MDKLKSPEQILSEQVERYKQFWEKYKIFIARYPSKRDDALSYQITEFGNGVKPALDRYTTENELYGEETEDFLRRLEEKEKSIEEELSKMGK